MLSARLGLVPFKGGKQGLLSFLKWFKKPEEDADDKFEKAFDYNTVVLHLKIECTRNEKAEKGETDPKKLYHNAQ